MNKSLLTTFGLMLLILVIPLTVMLAEKRQDIRNLAVYPTQSPPLAPTQMPTIAPTIIPLNEQYPPCWPDCRCPGGNCDQCGSGGWWGSGCDDFCSRNNCNGKLNGPLTACGGFEKQCTGGEQPESSAECLPGTGFSHKVFCGNDGCYHEVNIPCETIPTPTSSSLPIPTKNPLSNCPYKTYSECGDSGCPTGLCEECSDGTLACSVAPAICKSGKTKVDNNGCSYSCQDRFWHKQDQSCDCNFTQTFYDPNTGSVKSCINGKYSFTECDNGTLRTYSVNSDEPTKTNEEICSSGKCHAGACIPKDNFCCENYTAVCGVDSETGNGKLLENCISGISCSSGSCIVPSPTNCKTTVLSDGCNYECIPFSSTFNVTYVDSIFQKVDPNCGNLRSASPNPNPNLSDWKKINYGLEISFPKGLDNFQIEDFYEQLISLYQTPMWQKINAKKIIVYDQIQTAAGLTEQVVRDAWGVYYYDKNTALVSTASLFYGNTGTLIHELAHSFSFCEENCNTLMDKWKKDTGWTTPNPDGSGITPSTPADTITDNAQKNELEDLADSVMYFIQNPQALLSVSPRRYNFIRDNLNNGLDSLNLYRSTSNPGTGSTSPGTNLPDTIVVNWPDNKSEGQYYTSEEVIEAISYSIDKKWLKTGQIIKITNSLKQEVSIFGNTINPGQTIEITVPVTGRN